MSDDTPDLTQFDLFDPAIQQCPAPHYAAMREMGSVFETDVGGTPVYLVTRHEAALAVVKDHETFSSVFGSTSMPASGDLARRLIALRDELGGWPPVNTMLTADPPEQTRYRTLVSKAFTPKAIAALEPTIRSLATGLTDDLLEATADGEIVDFVTTFAVPLPVTTIAKALNVPDDRLADFKRWSDDATAGIGSAISDDRRVEAERSIIEFQHYFADQLEQRRGDPKDDILTNLLTARIDRDDPTLPTSSVSTSGAPSRHSYSQNGGGESVSGLDTAEMLSILQQLLVAGNQTTTKMLAEMMRLFGEHPSRWQAVRNDPSLVNPAVEEILRLSTPTQGMWRKATRDAEIDGVAIPAGARLVVMFASANRDDDVFSAPDDFDPQRSGLGNHLAFGKGAHYCLGANLARMEARIALEELSGRIPSFTLADTNTFDYLPSFMLRGLTRLDLQIP